MGAARIVVIEHDDWVLQLLLSGLREGGLVVATAQTAEDGLKKVRELVPDCVLCDVALPGDGYQIPRALRAEQPPLSLIPVAMLAADDDIDARTATYEHGADTLITKPFRLEEVTAQINALVQLAHRMRARRTSLIDSLGAGPPSSESASFRGELEHMPIASLLTLLELERKTGSVSVKSGKRRATLDLADGHVAGGALDGVSCDPVAVLTEALEWTEGRITFRATLAAPRPPNARSIRIILAEARGAAPPSVAGPKPRQSNMRMQAIPPPPGNRKTADEKPALVDTPTRRVDVPTVSAAHRETAKTEDTAPPPTTRRPR